MFYELTHVREMSRFIREKKFCFFTFLGEISVFERLEETSIGRIKNDN